MNSETASWVILGIFNIPLYLGLDWLFFDDWAGFFDCFRGGFLPSAFLAEASPEWTDAWWAKIKLFVFLALCVVAVSREHLMWFGTSGFDVINRLLLRYS